MDLSSILNVLAAGNNASEIGKQFNLDSDKVTQVINSALPTLIGAMQKNASTENGAASLSKALTSHLGDTSINLSSASLADGSKILGHILGGDSNSMFSALAKQTGTSNSQVSGILSSIAPVLLSLIGKGQQSSNTGIGGLGGLLGGLLGGGGSSSGGGLGSILGGVMSDKNNNGIPDAIEGFMK
jgi:hypothetical protein